MPSLCSCKTSASVALRYQKDQPQKKTDVTGKISISIWEKKSYNIYFYPLDISYTQREKKKKPNPNQLVNQQIRVSI